MLRRYLATATICTISLVGCKPGGESSTQNLRTAKPAQFGDGKVEGDPEATPAPEGGPGIQANTGAQNTAGCANAVDLPDVGSGTGQVLFNITTNTIDPCSVTGSVVGQGNFALVPTKSGRYFIDGLPEGTYDVVITANSLGLVDATQGTRINDIRVENGAREDRPGVAIGALGSISGRVRLSDETVDTAEGTLVSIPGTSYNATVGPEGTYTIANVPPGTHDLRFEKTNFRVGALGSIVVPAAAQASADVVELIVQEGEVGTLFVPGSDLIFTSLDVEYFLFPATTPELMRVSDSPLFPSQRSVPFRTSGIYSFPVDEALRIGQGAATKTLYVELQDGAITETVFQRVAIDLFGDVRNRADIVEPVASEINGNLTFDVVVKRPQNATAYRTSTTAGEFGDWVPFDPTNSDPVTVSVSGTDEGQVTVFAQFLTAEGVISPTFSADVNITIFPADSVSFSVAAPLIDAVYEPVFQLTDIAHPLPVEEATIVVATNADFSDAAEYAGTSTAAELNIGEQCGDHTVYLKVVHEPSGIESPVLEKSLTYRCVISLRAQGLNGNKLPLRSGGLFYRDRYYHLGGHDDSDDQRLTSQSYYFDFKTEQWRLMSEINAPAPRLYGDYFGYNGKVILFDGIGSEVDGFKRSDNKNPDGGIYDPESNSWERIPPIDEQIPGIGSEIGDSNANGKTRSILIGDRLSYLFATGKDRKDFGHYFYDLSDKQWTVVETKAISASNVLDRHIISGGPYIFMFGGSNNEWDHFGVANLLDNWFYDSRSNIWKKMSARNQPLFRNAPILTHVDGKFFVWGGFYRDGADLKDRLGGALFDPETNTWKTIAEAPDGRSTDQDNFNGTDTLVEVYNNKVYVFGGNSRKTRNVVWFGLIYDLATDSWSPMSLDNLPKRGEDFNATRVGDEVVLYLEDDFEFTPENNIKVYDFATDTWRDSVVDSNNLSGENLLGRTTSVAKAGPGRYLHFGRIALENEFDDRTFARDGFLAFEQKNPLTIVALKLDGSLEQTVRKGVAHNVELLWRNRQIELTDVTTTLAVVSGPATATTDTIATASVAANTETLVQGLQLEVDDSAQTNDLIVIEVSYSNETYSGSERFELLVEGRAGPQAQTSRQQDDAAILGSRVKISVPFVNTTGEDFVNALVVNLEGVHCLENLGLPLESFPIPFNAGSTHIIELEADIPTAGCSHGERGSFQLSVVSDDEVLVKVRPSIVLGLKTYRIDETYDANNPNSGYVRYDSDLGVDDDSGENQLLEFNLTIGAGETFYDMTALIEAIQTEYADSDIVIRTDADLGDTELPTLTNIYQEQRILEDNRTLSPGGEEYEWSLFGLMSARSYKEFGSENDGVESFSNKAGTESGLHAYNELVGKEVGGTWTIIPIPDPWDVGETKFSKFGFTIQTIVPEP